MTTANHIQKHLTIDDALPLRQPLGVRISAEADAMLRIWCSMTRVDLGRTVDCAIRRQIAHCLGNCSRKFNKAFDAAVAESYKGEVDLQATAKRDA